MTRAGVDVFISGGGIAGLAAAAAFGKAGFSVLAADPTPPVETAEADGSDLRSTAFLQPARDLFERTGLWEALAPHATPLDVLRAVDTVGWPPEIRASRDFRADDISDRPFGWNLPNWQTRHVLTGTIASMPNVELRMGRGFARLLTRDREAIVTLTDGATLSARLVVAADGRDSPVREAAGIGVATTRYGQKAIAFNVTHPHPHENVSTELYNEGGAFVLVPLPDLRGGPASAVVWMNDGRRSLDLLAMDETAFSREATLRSCGVLGDLTLASPRRLWPVVTQRAARLTAQRTAIVAEAAHVLPPIGAQGLNTSLHDIVALADLAAADPGSLGSPTMLAAYEAARERDIRARAAVIDLFNRVCRSGEVPVQALRLAGLKAVHDIVPLRRAVMRAGLGASQST
jgi:2-octaprenyl-6-methoxyphenol hydroxylase